MLRSLGCMLKRRFPKKAHAIAAGSEGCTSCFLNFSQLGLAMSLLGVTVLLMFTLYIRLVRVAS